MAIQQRTIDYTHDGVTMKAAMYFDDRLPAAPAVLVSHAWAGQTDFERSRAEHLANLGYVGIAIDNYGEGRTGSNPEENTAMMMPLLQDRARLQARLGAAVEMAKAQPEVLSHHIAAIGFCFGGLCVLDLARTRDDLAGVVSFHGNLSGADNVPAPQISAKVLVLHGYDDPMVKPEAVIAFADEMKASGADWQLHAYGGTVHSFTNPAANSPEMGMAYQADAARRSAQAMANFLEEIFAA